MKKCWFLGHVMLKYPVFKEIEVSNSAKAGVTDTEFPGWLCGIKMLASCVVPAMISPTTAVHLSFLFILMFTLQGLWVQEDQ